MGYLKGLKENGGGGAITKRIEFWKDFLRCRKKHIFLISFTGKKVFVYICLCKSSNKKVHLTVINVV